MKKKLFLLLALTLALLMLSACSLRPSSNVTAEPTPVATPEPTPTPTPTPPMELNIVTPTPEATPTPTPTPEATPEPTPTPTPTPTPAPTPTPSNLPRITKNPTDEKVVVNGSCMFIAKYENAKLAEWHFVSPDGKRDLDYKQAESEFKTLKIINGYTKDLTLENIPEALNGWKVYCRFSNDAGSANTEKASITVAANAAELAPKITKSPTGETVDVGGAATFVAKHQDAIWAVWHFVSADGTRDLTYTEAKTQFPTLTINGGDQGTLKLSNIPAELNGWKVYCEFRNNVGAKNTDSALITVRGTQTQNQTQTQTQAGTTAAANTQNFTGSWRGENDARYNLIMTGSGNNRVTATITWSSNTSERSVWTMNADAAANGAMEYRDGEYWVEFYEADNSYSVSNKRSGGSGSFRINDQGKLVWHDGVTGDMIFTR